MSPSNSTSKSNLKKYIKVENEDFRIHICEECGYAASKKSHLKRHIDMVHENIRNHACEDCGYTASQKSALERHKKSKKCTNASKFKKVGEKWPCGTCGH